MNIDKYIKVILILIVIINFIASIFLVTKEQIVLNVNEENKYIIISYLIEKVDSVKAIKKVGVGQGWHSGEIYVYYSLDNVKTLDIYEGGKLGELVRYVKENGYSLDSVARILTNISISIIVLLIIGKVAQNARE